MTKVCGICGTPLILEDYSEHECPPGFKNTHATTVLRDVVDRVEVALQAASLVNEELAYGEVSEQSRAVLNNALLDLRM